MPLVRALSDRQLNSPLEIPELLLLSLCCGLSFMCPAATKQSGQGTKGVCERPDQHRISRLRAMSDVLLFSLGSARMRCKIAQLPVCTHVKEKQPKNLQQCTEVKCASRAKLAKSKWEHVPREEAADSESHEGQECP